MGYDTTFSGGLHFNKPVAEWLEDYINEFSANRRLKRDPEKIKELYPNWGKFCFNGELGVDGEYFTGENSYRDQSVVDYNRPPSTQPGLWCQWIIHDGELTWDGNEKFYEYEAWLQYLIDNFFEPLGYVLNGDIKWQGEDSEDFGCIHVEDNVIEMQYGEKVYSTNEYLKEVKTEDLIAELKERGYNVAV